MAVPYTFGSATTSIPLSQLDSNFATTITLGNTAIQLGNTVTTLNNMTLANVTISSGTSSIIPTSIANGTSNVTIASSSGNISLNTNGSQAILIDTNQNLATGGATMPPNTVYPGLFLNYGVSLTGWAAKTFLSYNSYNVGTQLKYRGTDAFSGFALDGSTMLFYNAASGTADTNLTPVERMRITSDGDLNVKRQVTSVTTNGFGVFAAGSGVTVADGATITLSSASSAQIICITCGSSGTGGVLFANYNTTVSQIGGSSTSISTTDAGSVDIAVYKSANNNTVTFKNRSGQSKVYRIAMFCGENGGTV